MIASRTRRRKVEDDLADGDPVALQPSLIFLNFWVWRHSEHSKDVDSINHSHVMSCFFHVVERSGMPLLLLV